MQRKLYELEDQLGYRAAIARRRFAKRLVCILSLWAGLAGDKIANSPGRYQWTP